MWKFIIAILSFTTASNAQTIIESSASSNQDTVIFGEARNADGSENEVLLEQPQNAPNPLGDPIVSPPASKPDDTPQPQVKQDIPPIGKVTIQNSAQNPAISDMTPQQMSNEIQNKLYQSGNRIYDIQSYPADDLQTINQNGQDNAVTNYPAY